MLSYPPVHAPTLSFGEYEVTTVYFDESGPRADTETTYRTQDGDYVTVGRKASRRQVRDSLSSFGWFRRLTGQCLH